MIQKNSSRGVSPIISVILMVLLSILLASIVSEYALDLIDLLETPAQASISFSESYNAESDTYDLDILWRSEGTVDSIYATRPDGTRTETIYEVGDSIEINNVEEGDTIQVLGNMEDGRTEVVQTYTVN